MLIMFWKLQVLRTHSKRNPCVLRADTTNQEMCSNKAKISSSWARGSSGPEDMAFLRVKQEALRLCGTEGYDCELAYCHLGRSW